MSVNCAKNIRGVLLRAYDPCVGFSGPCNVMRWNPEAGHIPRGFCGATADASDVELILVCAEPGDPHEKETHVGRCSLEYLDSAIKYAYECFKNGTDQFHKNIRLILDSCYPGESFDSQMRRTWITDSVKCSAQIECGSVPTRVGKACRSNFLEAELTCFPKALVVALGKKAAVRLKDIPGVLNVAAAAPPHGISKKARATWKAIPEALNRKRNQNQSKST